MAPDGDIRELSGFAQMIDSTDKTPVTDEAALRRRRLRYRAWHRGTREMDLVLGPFVDATVDAMSAEEITRLEQFMAADDTDLLSWVVGQSRPPEGVDCALLERVISFRATNSPSR